jgi:hypothetical protein
VEWGEKGVKEGGKRGERGAKEGLKRGKRRYDNPGLLYAL